MTLRIYIRRDEAYRARRDRRVKLVNRYHAGNWFKGFGLIVRLLPVRPEGSGYQYRVQDWSRPPQNFPRCLTRPGPIRTGGRGLMRSASFHAVLRMDRCLPF